MDPRKHSKHVWWNQWHWSQMFTQWKPVHCQSQIKQINPIVISMPIAVYIAYILRGITLCNSIELFRTLKGKDLFFLPPHPESWSIVAEQSDWIDGIRICQETFTGCNETTPDRTETLRWDGRRKTRIPPGCIQVMMDTGSTRINSD